MESSKTSSRALWISALILSLGFIISALVVGYNLQKMKGSNHSITVKGLAEKPIKSDSARWEVRLQSSRSSASVTEAYQLLAQEMEKLQKFFSEHGFKPTEIKLGNKSSQPFYREIEQEDGRITREFQGYVALQSLTIQSRDIAKIEKAARDAYLLDEQGISIEQKPEYLVSNLEEIKMSLIANATQNAHSRANEFAKVGGVNVGMMRSASQGAFYILPEGGSDQDSDYGGAYDKETINKIARVVVTINYAID